MKIDRVTLMNFRNYQQASVELHDGINFVVGANAQGKTNLLESIFLSSVGKSPKNSKDKQIINFNAERAKIEIDFSTRAGKKNIEIFLDKANKKSIKINKLNILKLTELVGTLSVVYFSPDELKLIKEVPEDRRNFLDISISQFDRPYLYELMRYDKILRQRNAILKSDASVDAKTEQLKLFTPQLIASAKNIISKRLQFIEKLKGYAQNIHTNITLDETLDIQYSYSQKPDMSIEEDLAREYERVLSKDIELGYTTIGPHRDDIIFRIDDKDCKYYASQGQQRTVALVVKLALMGVVRDEIGEFPILLLDDVLSELDMDRQTRLINLCRHYQTIITCTAIPSVDFNVNIIKIKNGAVV